MSDGIPKCGSCHMFIPRFHMTTVFHLPHLRHFAQGESELNKAFCSCSGNSYFSSSENLLGPGSSLKDAVVVLKCFTMASVDNLKYQCPACLKQLFPPVFQCTIGHLVCKNCIIKFDKCPTCKIPIVSDPQHGKIRNREVEKIIRDYQTHECPSPKCAKRMKLEDLAEHRPKCIHK